MDEENVTTEEVIEETPAVEAPSDELSIAERLEQHIESVDAAESEEADVKEVDAEPSQEATSETTEEYTPDYSYSIKGEPKEFDEKLKSLINSKEDEDFVRDLVTRAEGLEDYKAKDTEWEQKYSSVEQRATQLTSGYKRLQGQRDSGDMMGLQESLGISDEMILDRATAILNEEELPQEQRDLIIKNRELSKELSSAQSRVSSYEESSQGERLQNDVQELKSFMLSDEYSPIVKAMEEAGRDFANEVVKEGHWVFNMTGKEPPVADIVKLVADNHRGLINAGSTMTQNNNNEELPTVVVQKETLPSVRGGADSAVDGGPQTLEDLYAISNQIKVGTRAAR